MALNVNGKKINKITVNGKPLSKVVANGKTVFESQGENISAISTVTYKFSRNNTGFADYIVENPNTFQVKLKVRQANSSEFTDEGTIPAKGTLTYLQTGIKSVFFKLYNENSGKESEVCEAKHPFVNFDGGIESVSIQKSYSNETVAIIKATTKDMYNFKGWIIEPADAADSPIQGLDPDGNILSWHTSSSATLKLNISLEQIKFNATSKYASFQGLSAANVTYAISGAKLDFVISNPNDCDVKLLWETNSSSFVDYGILKQGEQITYSCQLSPGKTTRCFKLRHEESGIESVEFIAQSPFVQLISVSADSGIESVSASQSARFYDGPSYVELDAKVKELYDFLEWKIFPPDAADFLHNFEGRNYDANSENTWVGIKFMEEIPLVVFNATSNYVGLKIISSIDYSFNQSDVTYTIGNKNNNFAVRLEYSKNNVDWIDTQKDMAAKGTLTFSEPLTELKEGNIRYFRLRHIVSGLITQPETVSVMLRKVANCTFSLSDSDGTINFHLTNPNSCAVKLLWAKNNTNPYWDDYGTIDKNGSKTYNCFPIPLQDCKVTRYFKLRHEASGLESDVYTAQSPSIQLISVSADSGISSATASKFIRFVDDPTSVNLSAVTKEGYTFKNWEISPSGAAEFYQHIEEDSSTLENTVVGLNNKYVGPVTFKAYSKMEIKPISNVTYTISGSTLNFQISNPNSFAVKLHYSANNSAWTDHSQQISANSSLTFGVALSVGGIVTRYFRIYEANLGLMSDTYTATSPNILKINTSAGTGISSVSVTKPYQFNDNLSDIPISANVKSGYTFDCWTLSSSAASFSGSNTSTSTTIRPNGGNDASVTAYAYGEAISCGTPYCSSNMQSAPPPSCGTSYCSSSVQSDLPPLCTPKCLSNVQNTLPPVCSGTPCTGSAQRSTCSGLPCSSDYQRSSCSGLPCSSDYQRSSCSGTPCSGDYQLSSCSVPCVSDISTMPCKVICNANYSGSCPQPCLTNTGAIELTSLMVFTIDEDDEENYL